ncbi:MAG: cyclic pyranopterin monophosphate synthase MoaC [Deltaproteobacteria bacterium]|nr:cyclic pyranopterin monophosphate synthase MoaC [Deltaproteobacteria bacterium]
MEEKLTHIDTKGNAKMVDIGAKEITRRIARASALVRMSPKTLDAIRENRLKKGEALSVARLAGILGAKKVDELVPLAHTIPLDHVSVNFGFQDNGIRVTAEAASTSRTGVELEAITSAMLASLAIYDMAKAIDRGMEITSVRLDYKSGGKSGTWTREE